MKRGERRYWDACCFIALITHEQGRAEDCRMLLDEARTGEHLVVTAAHTLVEITRKSNVGNLYDHRSTIDRIFESSYFLDRAVAEQARDLIWQHGTQGLRWSDALHLAAAERSESRRFSTYDKTILKLGPAFRNLTIEEPKWVGQAPLGFPAPP